MLIYRAFFDSIEFKNSSGVKKREVHIGIFVGAVMLIAAPGNYVRLAVELGDANEINYINNFITITKMFFDTDFLCVPVGVSLICYMLNKGNKNNDKVSWFYILGLIVSMYSMAATTYYSDSPKVISLIFAVIILGRCWVNILMNLLCNRKVWILVIILMIIFDGNMYKTAIRDTLAYEERNNFNVEMVLEAKKSGNMDPVVMKNVWTSKYGAVPAGVLVLRTNPKDWRNNAFANYYGLNTIRVEPEDFEDFEKPNEINIKQRLIKGDS